MLTDPTNSSLPSCCSPRRHSSSRPGAGRRAAARTTRNGRHVVRTARPHQRGAEAPTSRTSKIPGAVLLVARQRQGRVVRGDRRARPGSGAPMTKDAIFRIYSMSKPITSVAAMMLVEEGKLKLDDPVAKYIPAFGEREGRRREAERGGRQAEARAGPPRRADDRAGPAAPHVRTDLRLLRQPLVKKAYNDAEAVRGAMRQNEEFAERLAKLPLAYQPGTHLGLQPLDRRARPRRSRSSRASRSTSS